MKLDHILSTKQVVFFLYFEVLAAAKDLLQMQCYLHEDTHRAQDFAVIKLFLSS